jgi:hypothetical protein
MNTQGADFANVIGGMMQALEEFHVPLVMSFNSPPHADWWHYAAVKKDGSNRTCQQADLSCYFLPFHPCGTDRRDISKATTVGGDGNGPHGLDDKDHAGMWAYQFVTRPQLWLRRAIYDYKKQIQLPESPQDCSVMHVRRADVVKHGVYSRKYYAVADYVNMLPSVNTTSLQKKSNHTIFLLTDDSNAILEAHEFFPHINWVYLDRQRHNGTSGGWENQTPSKNPKLETIVIMSIFELAQQCNNFVHGRSSFSSMIWTHMQRAGATKHRYHVDAGVADKKHKDNTNGETMLHTQLEKMRQGKKAGIPKIDLGRS